MAKILLTQASCSHFACFSHALYAHKIKDKVCVLFDSILSDSQLQTLFIIHLCVCGGRGGHVHPQSNGIKLVPLVSKMVLVYRLIEYQFHSGYIFHIFTLKVPPCENVQNFTFLQKLSLFLTNRFAISHQMILFVG